MSLAMVYTTLKMTSSHNLTNDINTQSHDFLVQFGINKHLLIFSKTTNCTSPRACAILLVFENIYSCLSLFQIGLEIMLLPIQKW